MWASAQIGRRLSCLIKSELDGLFWLPLVKAGALVFELLELELEFEWTVSWPVLDSDCWLDAKFWSIDKLSACGSSSHWSVIVTNIKATLVFCSRRSKYIVRASTIFYSICISSIFMFPRQVSVFRMIVTNLSTYYRVDGDYFRLSWGNAIWDHLGSLSVSLLTYCFRAWFYLCKIQRRIGWFAS